MNRRKRKQYNCIKYTNKGVVCTVLLRMRIIILTSVEQEVTAFDLELVLAHNPLVKPVQFYTLFL